MTRRWRGMTRRWRGATRPLAAAALAALTAVTAGVLLAAPAYAQASLAIGDVTTGPGSVEFHLTARGLAVGQEIDPASVTVEADGTPLALIDTVEVATLEAEPDDVRLAVLVIDISNSMAGQPLADAIAAASAYIARLPDDIDVAVVSVSSQALLRLAPTGARDQVQQTLNGLFAGGSTALYDGLALAADVASDPTYTERRILLLSDGADSGSFTTLATARQRLTDAEAPVDTVAFQTDETVTELLASIAADTGGQAYLAQDAAGLASAFDSAVGAFGVRMLIRAQVPPELSGAETTLRVSLQAGGQTVATAVPVTLAVDPDAIAPLTTAPAAGLSWLNEWVVVALVFAGLLAVGLVIFSPLLDRSLRRRRLAQVDQFSVAAPAAPRPPVVDQQESGSQVTRAALALSQRVVDSRGLEGRLATQLDRAGMRMRPHEWLLLRGLVCVTAAILLALFIHPVWALLLGVVGGWLATALYHRNRAEKRVQAFATLLPDALQLIIGSLRSGFSLSQAVDAMAREMPDPIASEFGRALGEARLGEPLEDGLERVARRMKSDDLSWSVVAIRVQQQVGGNLAEVLSTTVGTIRERDSLRRHVRALSAEGRLSAWILIALPILAAVFMFGFRAEYARPLITDPLGLVMLLVGIVLVSVGSFWMTRVVKVEI
jgi:Flp pilus assembly protein TadB/Mg-chelatase subunit ChlD